MLHSIDFIFAYESMTNGVIQYIKWGVYLFSFGMTALDNQSDCCAFYSLAHFYCLVLSHGMDYQSSFKQQLKVGLDIFLTLFFSESARKYL